MRASDLAVSLFITALELTAVGLVVLDVILIAP